MYIAGHGKTMEPHVLTSEKSWKMLEKDVYERGLQRLTEMFLKLKTTDNGKHLKEIEAALKTLDLARKG